MTASRRNLILSTIGDHSVHASWLSHPELRSFDLFLIYYGDQDEFGRDEATHYVRRKGFKWQLVSYAVEQCGEILGRYTNIWCPDNDIRVDTFGVNRLFELFEQYALQLAQPAIAAGEVSYQSLRRRAGLILRYTPFVEVMCPVFTRTALSRVAPTFRESRSGWGLDWVWPRFFAPHEMAILDAVGVEHAGPLGRGENYQHLARLGIDPGEEFRRLVEKYGGYNPRLHRKLVRGRIHLPAVREPAACERLGIWSRLAQWLGLRPRAA